MTLATDIKILLIEDNLAEARLLREILKGSTSHPFQIVHVQRLSDGLQKLRAEPFDEILLDLTLPDSEGLDSLHPLLAENPRIPIVVLTNHNDDHLALAAVRAGAQDYLVKRNATLESLVRSLCYAIERKQAEEKIRNEHQSLEADMKKQGEELQKAQALNQLKSEFVSMISHDFRNPLNIILLSADLLEECRDKLSAEQQFNYFQMIRNAIKDMDQLLTEVLLLGKADSGKLECHFIPLDLHQFCQDLVANLNQTQALENPIHLVFTGQLSMEMWDKHLLKHIFHNLLGNAVKYSPPQQPIHFRIQVEPKTVTFQIQDQGIGIPPEALSQLFNPFFRADNAHQINGTGLGLTIVQRCVEVYGGDLKVESTVGQGSCFTVVLPRQSPPERYEEGDEETLNVLASSLS